MFTSWAVCLACFEGRNFSPLSACVHKFHTPCDKHCLAWSVTWVYLPFTSWRRGVTWYTTAWHGVVSWDPGSREHRWGTARLKDWITSITVRICWITFCRTTGSPEMVYIQAVSLSGVNIWSKVIDSVEPGGDVVDWATPHRNNKICRLQHGTAVVESLLEVERKDAGVLWAFLNCAQIEARSLPTCWFVLMGGVEWWFLACALSASFIFTTLIGEAKLLCHPW